MAGTILLNLFPKEIISEIAKRLNIQDLKRLSLCCSNFNPSIIAVSSAILFVQRAGIWPLNSNVPC